MKEFYAHSRLHFISTWRRTLTDKLQQQPDPEAVVGGPAVPSPPPLPLGGGPAPRSFIHVDMDCFFAAVAMRDNPRLRDVPLAIAHGNAKSVSSEVEAFCCHMYLRSGTRADCPGSEDRG